MKLYLPNSYHPTSVLKDQFQLLLAVHVPLDGVQRLRAPDHAIGAQARLQAGSDELPKLARLDELEATAAAPQQASGEEEIEEICTPSVAADLRRERRAQGMGREGESSEGEGEESEESEEGESDEFDSDASSASEDGIGAFPFY